ncbi:SRPBCC family protein [Candidatus Marinimicrobia bacterium]|nr:SRPBCC family protein [Candidatus Neomarinimicrobiota bacterium]
MSNSSQISVKKDIAQAELISPEFYNNTKYFEKSKKNIFEKSLQFIVHKDSLHYDVNPFVLLKDLIDEPYVLIKKKDIKILSNICTHRANILCNSGSNNGSIKCNYHGRTFSLDGILKKYPGFEGVENFPTENDNLRNIPYKSWKNFIFTSMKTPINIEGVFADIDHRLGSYPFNKLSYNSAQSNTYLIDAHWALYCENYLEGFHVPFIHRGLNREINYDNYKTEILDHGVLQYVVNQSKPSIPQILNDNMYAYYYWIFPNMMFNFYNWGISINIIEPINKQKTRIRFLSFPIKGFSPPNNKSSDLNTVEQEDQQVVLSVQKGISSFNYNGGRYSAKHEQGLHYFHQLISRYLN